MIVLVSYLKNERFIHTDLLKLVQASVDKVYDVWKRDQKIAPVFITWPGETIKDDKGAPLEGMCVLDLPNDTSRWSTAMRAMVQRTKAYALLFIEEQNEAVKVIFESPHGTRAWTLPIRRSGDVRLLGDASVKDNVESVGYLWTKNRAQS